MVLCELQCRAFDPFRLGRHRTAEPIAIPRHEMHGDGENAIVFHNVEIGTRYQPDIVENAIVFHNVGLVAGANFVVDWKPNESSRSFREPGLWVSYTAQGYWR